MENEYSSYLSSHAGHSNAYTASTHTNYFFECAASSEKDQLENGDADSAAQAPQSESLSRGPFYGALDRFAQFFLEPLFLESTLERELRAVDSENKKNLQSDQWRLMQLSKTLSNPKHPFSKFSTGNLETLREVPEKGGVKIREKFIEFYEKHYSANRMKLVVLGKEPLDELELWVDELFASVKNKDLARKRWDGPEQPLTQKELCTQIFAKPVMESRRLEIWFPFQDEEEMYETQPSRYMGHLIGHEGPGSILAYLKEKGWANSLTCSYGPICPGTAFFDIDIRLTPDGLQQYHEILKVVFNYIAMMKEEPPQEWIFDEMKRMGEVNFRFRQKSRAVTFTYSTSSVMQKPLPRNWLLSGSSRLRKFDPDAVAQSIQYLRPDNFRLMISSQDHLPPLDQKEKWYKTEYAVQKIPDELSTQLEIAAQCSAKDRPPGLHLPHKNEFIPTRLDVEKREVLEPAKAPKLIRNDQTVRLWWKKDDRFWVPKSNLFTTIRTESAHATPADTVKATLFCELVKDSLSEYSYDADISGLSYTLANVKYGIVINLGGYSDKLAVLMRTVVERIRDFTVSKARFDIIKERLTRTYKNWFYSQPCSQANVEARWLIQGHGWNTAQLAAELPHIEADDVQNFIPHIFGRNHIEMLVHGDLGRHEAVEIAEMVEEILKPRALPQSWWYSRREISLPPRSSFLYEKPLVDPANVNHAIEYRLFLGDGVDRVLAAKAQLLAQMMQEPTFDRLRTKEQLGYMVFSGSTGGSSPSTWYHIIVQSERDPPYLETRIDNHLVEYATELDQMSDTDFEAHRRSLINKKLESLKNLDAESGRFEEIIHSEYYDFFRIDEGVAELKKLSKVDMQNFYREWIDPHSPTRAKLSVHMIAQGKASDENSTSQIPREQQIQAVCEALSEFLASSGVHTDPDAIKTALQDVDITAGDQDGVIAAVRRHLSSNTSTSTTPPPPQVDTIEAQMKQVLPSLFMALGIKKPSSSGPEAYKNDSPTIPNGTAPSDGTGETSKQPVMITDVDEWRARLRLSEARRPLVDLRNYEEVESKL